MLPANLDYMAPATLNEAVALLASHPDALVVGGNARAVIDLKMRRISPPLLIDLRKISELYGVQAEGNGRRIGAMTALRTIMDDEAIRASYTALAEAAEVSGDAQMRNMETLGANLTYDAHTSDAAAAALVLNAQIRAVRAGSERTIAASDYFGANPLAQGEIVTSVSLPANDGISAYEKFKHPATLSAVCGVAVNVTLGADRTVQRCALAVIGATARPTRLGQAEAALQGQPLNAATVDQAAAAAGEGLEFVAGVYASADYRAHLLKVLLKRALTRLTT